MGQISHPRFKNSYKKKFVTTESALYRAYELSLTKEDPMIAKCIKLLERYVRGEETWPDWVEKHKDNGRGHMFGRPYGSAARLNMFDPENPAIQPLRNNLAAALEITSKNNFSCENIWKQGADEYYIARIATPSMYSALLLQNSRCMSDELERQYLDYLWNKKDGIYYVSSVPPANKQYIENRLFLQWISTLELLSGFSLFSEFMKKGALPHILNEIDRLMNGSVDISHIKTGRYADSWRDKNKHETDLILRLTRLIIKC